MFDPGLWAQLACLWEATARKAGNVHRARDFADLTYLDFLHSACAIGPVLARSPGRRLGDTILDAVRATRRVVRTNTNLGIVLLLAPLAAVPPGTALRPGVARVLDDLDVADARAAYAAIRLASPGGLGDAAEQDVRAEPTLGLRDVMVLARDHDLIARQYADGFRAVFDEGVPALRHALHAHDSFEAAIIATHLHLMAASPDSLIARKRGAAEAAEAARRAAEVLAAGGLTTDRGRRAFAELDAWLRAEGHARNPGTSADLVTACLFAALREGIIALPLSMPWSVAGTPSSAFDSGSTADVADAC